MKDTLKDLKFVASSKRFDRNFILFSLTYVLFFFILSAGYKNENNHRNNVYFSSFLMTINVFFILIKPIQIAYYNLNKNSKVKIITTKNQFELRILSKYIVILGSFYIIPALLFAGLSYKNNGQYVFYKEKYLALANSYNPSEYYNTFHNQHIQNELNKLYESELLTLSLYWLFALFLLIHLFAMYDKYSRSFFDRIFNIYTIKKE